MRCSALIDGNSRIAAAPAPFLQASCCCCCFRRQEHYAPSVDGGDCGVHKMVSSTCGITHERLHVEHLDNFCTILQTPKQALQRVQQRTTEQACSQTLSAAQPKQA
jgi:hypothetical protein